MAGLLDFLMQGGQGQGGGLFGMFGQPQQQPQNILPPGMAPNLAGNTNPYPGGVDPTIYALRALQNPPDKSMFDNPMISFGLGLAGGNTAGEGLQGAAKMLQLQQAQRSQQSQEALKNYIALKGLGIQEKAAEEKPQYIPRTLPSGEEVLVKVDPYGKGFSTIRPTQLQTPAVGGQPGQSVVSPPVPPGVVNEKAYHEGIAKDAAANQQDAVASAKAAAAAQPLIDEVMASYKAAHELGAVGPVTGSTPGRYLATGMSVLGNATGLGSQSKDLEAARQRYDKAVSALQMHANAFKGQGQVSNYERSLARAQYPDLTALHPEDQVAILNNMAQENRRTIEAGKMSPLSQTPAAGAVLDRGAITPGTQTQAPPMRIPNKATFDALPSGSVFIAPDGSTRRKP